MKWSEKVPCFNYRSHYMNTTVGWLLLYAARITGMYRVGDPRWYLKGYYKEVDARNALHAISLAGRAFEMPDPADHNPYPRYGYVAATFEERVAARRALREVLAETGRLDLTICGLGNKPLIRRQTMAEWAAHTGSAEQVACLVMAAYRADCGLGGIKTQSFNAEEVQVEHPADRVVFAAACALRAGEYSDAWEALRAVSLPEGADEEGRTEAQNALREVLNQTGRGCFHIDLPWHRDVARQSCSPAEWAERTDPTEQVACLVMAIEFCQQFWHMHSAIRMMRNALASGNERAIRCARNATIM